MIETFNKETILVFGYAQRDDKKALIVEHTSKLVREDETWATKRAHGFRIPWRKRQVLSDTQRRHFKVPWQLLSVMSSHISIKNVGKKYSSHLYQLCTHVRLASKNSVIHTHFRNSTMWLRPTVGRGFVIYYIRCFWKNTVKVMWSCNKPLTYFGEECSMNRPTIDILKAPLNFIICFKC